MNFAAFPETCYRIYKCKKCGKVSIVEDPNYYPSYFEIIEFPRYSFYNFVKDICNAWIESIVKYRICQRIKKKKIKAEEDKMYYEIFRDCMEGEKKKIYHCAICRNCIESQENKAIFSKENPISLYREAKEEYRKIVIAYLEKEMDTFKKNLPCKVLREFNPEAYLNLANPDNTVEEKKKFAREYVEETGREIIEYLKNVTMKNCEVIKKRKEVLKREKEVVKFLGEFDDKINRYQQKTLNSGEKMLTPDNYIFKKEGIKKKYRTMERMCFKVEQYNKKSILRKIEEGRAFDVFSGAEERFETWLKDLPAKLAKKIYKEE